jgi:hypothetical protein
MPETAKPPPNRNPAPSSAPRPLTGQEIEFLRQDLKDMVKDAKNYFRKKREAPETGQACPEI